MPLTINAWFPLGTYQGRNATGQPEKFPAPDRLFAAFVAAAGAGPYAEQTKDGHLRIADRHRPALEWLERNPPDRLLLPGIILNQSDATAYRRSGMLSGGKYAHPASTEALNRSSLNGSLVWRWNKTPDDSVVKALTELSSEVAYLGEANSPVIIRIATDSEEPQKAGTEELIRAPDSELLPRNAIPISTAAAGRLQALESAHENIANLKWGAKADPIAGEREHITPRPGTGLRTLWYKYPASWRSEQLESPWVDAIILGMNPEQHSSSFWPPAPENRVSWSVALHRTLSMLLSPHAPPLITGRYSERGAHPANRLAIQIITKQDPVGWDWDPACKSAFALLIPRDTSAEDHEQIMRAVQLIAGRIIRRTRSEALTVGNIQFVNGKQFWRDVPDGFQRWWIPNPLAIAETRALPARADGSAWSIENAAQLSIGMVWRDLFGINGRGTKLYHDLAGIAAEFISVRQPRRIHSSSLFRYAHRTNSSTVVTGYTALINLGELGDVRMPVAIGQSRHLGTGLLTPVDIPESPNKGSGNMPWP